MVMKLDGTIQQSSSYRPHYHEFAVHFPARFLENVERVLFVGGGDSMVLHEVLKCKYGTLENICCEGRIELILIGYYFLHCIF